MKLHRRLAITKASVGNGPEFLWTLLYENDQLVEIDASQPGASILGNIYIARVQNVMWNLNAAFVEIEKGVVCYLSLNHIDQAIFTKKISKKSIAQGEELLVQVTREAVKTKAAVVSENISLSASYCVLSTGNRSLGISAKLPAEVRESLRDAFLDFDRKNYGMVIRTSAADISKKVIEKEALRLIEQMDALIQTAKHKESRHLLLESKDYVFQTLEKYPMNQIQEIITDQEEIQEMLLHKYCGKQLQEEQVHFYKEESYDFTKFLGLEHQIEKALRKRVWLKSGANIIIEQTEALTVIDVNSGKNIKKASQEHFLNINKEAAREICHQMRLRNLSGIILVDFINLEKEQEEPLIHYLQQELRKDPIGANFVDLTKLGLVEITRKKVKKTLGEQLSYDQDIITLCEGV